MQILLFYRLTWEFLHPFDEHGGLFLKFSNIPVYNIELPGKTSSYT